MRAVFGLIKLDQGAVRWHGATVCPADRARFGYMPEERGLYPRMRVRDQLVYLGQLCGRKPKDVDRSVGAWLVGPQTAWTRCRTATSSGSS
jgi:ABC-2 type transport system ATP-binding protein